MFRWDWYLHHSKSLNTTFRHIEPVHCVTCTAKCLSWLVSQEASACGDPLGKNWQPISQSPAQSHSWWHMHHCFKVLRGQAVLSPPEKGEGQALAALILLLLMFVCGSRSDQPSFTHLLYSRKPLQWSQWLCLHVSNEKSPQSVRPAQSSTFRYKKKKEHNEVLDTHTGLCHREHHPFSAVDISEWGPEALHPQGSKQMKVYTAFCSSLPESHTIRPKLSFLAITPQSVFIVLGYRNVQIKARHKTRFRIGVSRSLGNGPQRANCLKLHYTAFVEMIMHLVYIWI